MSNKIIHNRGSEDILIALDQVEQTIEVMCDTLVRLKEKVNIHLIDAEKHSSKVAQNMLEESVAPKNIRH